MRQAYATFRVEKSAIVCLRRDQEGGFPKKDSPTSRLWPEVLAITFLFQLLVNVMHATLNVAERLIL